MLLDICVLLQVAGLRLFGLHILCFKPCCGSIGAAMPPSTSDVFYGCTESFTAFLLSVCPFVVDETFRHGHHGYRDRDFLELFSGKGHLSQELKNATRIE